MPLFEPSIHATSSSPSALRGPCIPPSRLVQGAFDRGARTVYLNLESLGGKNPYFEEEHLGKAEEIVPLLFGDGLPSSP